MPINPLPHKSGGLFDRLGAEPVALQREPSRSAVAHLDRRAQGRPWRVAGQVRGETCEVVLVGAVAVEQNRHLVRTCGRRFLAFAGEEGKVGAGDCAEGHAPIISGPGATGATRTLTGPHGAA